MDWGTLAVWIGTIAGAGVGLLGGVVGTYFSIKNTKGPRERAFMIKASVICWIFVFAFITGMAVIPGWYNLLLGIPYTVLLIFGILKSNQIQLRIRKEESGGLRTLEANAVVPPVAQGSGRASGREIGGTF